MHPSPGACHCHVSVWCASSRQRPHLLRPNNSLTNWCHVCSCDVCGAVVAATLCAAQVNEGDLERVRRIKSRLVRLTTRVETVRHCPRLLLFPCGSSLGGGGAAALGWRSREGTTPLQSAPHPSPLFPTPRLHGIHAPHSTAVLNATWHPPVPAHETLTAPLPIRTLPQPFKLRTPRPARSARC